MVSRVDGVVLAAGLASRMAAAKLELDIDGIPVINRVVQAAVDSRLGRVIVVVGPCAHSLIRTLGSLLKHAKIRVAKNPEPEKGMSGSMATGIRALETGCTGVMIILGDQPLIGAHTIDRLVTAFGASPDRIVAPLVGGRRTNPVTFPAALFSQLQRVRGDVGGREVLQRNRAMVVGIEVGDGYDDADLDTPEDVRLIREKVLRMKSQEP